MKKVKGEELGRRLTSPLHRVAALLAREKKAKPLLVRCARAPDKGAATRPLDGGALTCWGARAPARWPATAPKSLALSLSVAATACCAEEGERLRERKKEMHRVSGAARGRGGF